MAIIKFKKREEPEILFGIKLPLIATNFYREIKNKKQAYEIIRDTFNIADGRLINIVDVRDANDNPALVLVVYNNFVTEREKMKMDLEIEVFDFSIFEFDYNNKIDVEDVITRIKN
ncbi:hypothetical protein EII29_00900 [Leptotrichia sp. OH3620_COT-345]|uniref:hypothetical protein n=1 Tax=Leptotrichia sp. OH3620_COT-345 TaxID=2491048 RepID=UPI000F647630|nr:hypothetical protein [Leptotrichia sp. OH3620_COT-345]RRD41039.1 hypothetical protein EII29_00900 [Leptotrichia sp. OH3620_COT-345]